MPEALDRLFLDYSCRKLEQQCGRIAEATRGLTDGQLWRRPGDQQNAIANLMLHLAGNVRQWILHGVHGQPDVRHRDAEFAARDGWSGDELRQHLGAAVADAVAVVRGLSAADLAATTRIQGYELSTLEAVYHVVEHFSHHAGQILFAVKLATNQDLGFHRHLAGTAHEQTTP